MAAKWFSSYLEGDAQAVVWGSSISNPANIRYGVHQGSIFGPCLFLLMVADLPRSIGMSGCTVSYSNDVVTV